MSLVANEVMEYTRRSKGKGLVLKLDFKEEYDQVNWRFLDRVMERKGFGCRWRK